MGQKAYNGWVTSSVRLRVPIPKHLTFGMAAHAMSEEAKARVLEWASFLSGYVGLPIGVVGATSYEELANLVRTKTVDLAWLPPIPYVLLDEARSAIALVTNHRLGQAQFEAVFIVRAGARVRTLQGLKGKRAAWVDPLSASGYVLPRIQLAALGLDPRTTFAEERILGSHEAVVRAVLQGEADVGATFAARDPESGQVRRGGWTHVEGAVSGLRVLGGFGAIPSDVVVARSDLRSAVRSIVAHGLAATSNVLQGKDLVRRVFGVDEFRVGPPGDYETLRAAVAKARERGLLDLAAGGPPTAGPGSSRKLEAVEAKS